MPVYKDSQRNREKINENEIIIGMYGVKSSNSFYLIAFHGTGSLTPYRHVYSSTVWGLSLDKQCEHCVFTVVAAGTAKARADLRRSGENGFKLGSALA